MELTEAYLRMRQRAFREAAEQQRRDAIANDGAADAIELILKDMSIQEMDDETLNSPI